MRFYQYHLFSFQITSRSSSQKEYFFDKRPSIGGHLPLRNATNDVTQNQELDVLLFQWLLSHNCPPRAGQLCDKIGRGRVIIFFQRKFVTIYSTICIIDFQRLCFIRIANNRRMNFEQAHPKKYTLNSLLQSSETAEGWTRVPSLDRTRQLVRNLGRVRYLGSATPCDDQVWIFKDATWLLLTSNNITN